MDEAKDEDKGMDVGGDQGKGQDPADDDAHPAEEGEEFGQGSVVPPSNCDHHGNHAKGRAYPDTNYWKRLYIIVLFTYDGSTWKRL